MILNKYATLYEDECEFGVEIGRVLGPTAEEVTAQPSPLEGRIPGTFPVEGASGPVMGAGGGRR